MKSAHEVLIRVDTQSQSRLFVAVWRLKIPQRLGGFTWLVVHEALLTNLSRWKRRMATDPSCPFCGVSKETVLHALQDCSVPEEIWKSIVNSSFHESFFSGSLLVWISENVMGRTRFMHGVVWPPYLSQHATLFGIIETFRF